MILMRTLILAMLFRLDRSVVDASTAKPINFTSRITTQMARSGVLISTER